MSGDRIEPPPDSAMRGRPVTVVLSVAELRCVADALTLMTGPAAVRHDAVLEGLRGHVVDVLGREVPT